MSLVGNRDMCLGCDSPLTKRLLTLQSSSLFPITAPGSSHAQLPLPVFFFLICCSHRCSLTQHTDFQGHEEGSTLSNTHLRKGTSSKCYWDPILGLTLMIPAVQQEQTFLLFIFSLLCSPVWLHAHLCRKDT